MLTAIGIMYKGFIIKGKSATSGKTENKCTIFVSSYNMCCWYLSLLVCVICIKYNPYSLFELLNLPQLKTFCEAVQGMRAAFELLNGLRSCKDRAGPPTAHLLEAAMVLGDANSTLDALEAIERHIDRSNKALRLHTQTQV